MCKVSSVLVGVVLMRNMDRWMDRVIKYGQMDGQGD